MPINPLYPTQDFSGFNVIGLEGLQFDGNASLGNLNVDNLLVDDDFIALNNIIVLADTSNISVIDNEALLGMGLKNNSLGVETIFTSQTSKGVSGTTSNNDFSLISNDIERILVKADGNIGIGNSNPMTPLSVEGNIYSNNIASLTSSVNNLTGNVSNLQQRMNVVEGNISILNGNVSSLTTRVADNEANIALLFTLSGNLDANINLITTRLANIENEINTGNLSTLEVLNGNTFINSGNFGLGTPTPTSKLQVLGNADISGSITSNSLNTSGITLTPTTTNLILGSSTTLQNKLNVNATTSQDKFIRFRRGGGAPVGYSGLQFSDFDTHSFYQGAFSNTLEFTYAPGNPTDRGNVGTPILSLNSFGNVGIGTSTPNQKLQVNGNINISGDYLINGTPIAASKWLQAGNDIYNTNTGNVGIGTSTPGFKLDVSGTTRTTGQTLLATSSGNVGIGTTTPVDKLQVNGNIYYGWDTSRRIMMDNTPSGDINNYRFGMLLDGTNRITQIFSTSGDTNSGGHIVFSTQNSVASGQSDAFYGTERMRITGDGNVGIGTSSPTAPLLVSKNTGILAEFRGATSECGIVVGDINAPNYNSDDAGYMTYRNQGGVKSLRWGLRGIADRMTLNLGDGNVGIGTISPAYLLDVSGTARITGQTLLATSSGNVGIGITSPTAKLHINGGQILQRISTGANTDLDFYNEVGGMRSRIRFGGTNEELSFWTQANERMTITGGGSIGIGTSSPSNKLDVRTADISYGIEHSSPTVRAATYIDGAGTNRGFEFGTITNHGMGFYTNNNTKMLITNDGNVGIGTNSPNAPLSVSRNIGNLADFRGNATNVQCFIVVGDINAADYSNDDAGYMAYQNQSGVKSLRWGLRGIADRMTLNLGDGNVGIGTTSPTQKLSVVGNGRISDGLTLFKTVGQPALIFENDQGITGSMRAEGFQSSGNAAIFFSSNIALGWQNNRRMLMNFDNNNNYRQGFEFDANARNLQLFTTSGDSGANIIFRTQTSVGGGQVDAFYGTERMRIQGNDGRIGIGTTSPGYLLDVSGTARTTGETVLATSSGSVGIGTTSPVNTLDVHGTARIRGNLACNTFNKSQVSGSANGISGSFNEVEIMSFFNSSSEGIIIEQNGDVKNTNNSYGAISDIRKKENIIPCNSQIEDFKKYNFVNYNLIDGIGKKKEKHLGLIAQDVMEISPGLVSYDENRDEYSVKYSILYLKACKCIQELIEKVEILENKINSLLNK